MNQTLSDNIICNDRMYNQYKFVRNNDLVFINQFTKSVPDSIRDIDSETNLRNSHLTNKNHCLQGAISRGNNNNNRECIQTCKDYGKYTPYNMQDFLLFPCEKSTYKNYLMTDDLKTCSKSHQMFDNNTKRKSIYSAT